MTNFRAPKARIGASAPFAKAPNMEGEPGHATVSPVLPPTPGAPSPTSGLPTPVLDNVNPFKCTTPIKCSLSEAEAESDSLVHPADPNLLCAICCSLFNEPMRTRCGHVFCAGCLQAWLPLKPECPECRASLDVDTDLSADRLVDSLVSNLHGFCQFRSAGCGWVGKRGERTAHIARDCLCVPVYCPNVGCAAEMARSDLAAHLESCAFASSCAHRLGCPYGCGAECDDEGALEAHQSECLYDPKKLMAAVKHLARENERLTAENLRLRSASGVAAPCLDAPDTVGRRTDYAAPRRKSRRRMDDMDD